MPQRPIQPRKRPEPFQLPPSRREYQTEGEHMVEAFCDILHHGLDRGHPDVATHLTVILLNTLAIFTKNHEKVIRAAIAPCGEEGCDCHIMKTQAIDSLMKHSETIPEDLIPPQ